MIGTIEIRPAYTWTCENCGRDQFERGIIAEPSPEDQAELREKHGIEFHETGTWMYAPRWVQCEACGTKFKTQHWSQ